MRVPLDPCGNPLPTAPAPAAAARPTSPLLPAPAPAPATTSPAPATPNPAPAESGPVKTFSDKPADVAPRSAVGWGASPLDHVDPKAAAADATPRAMRVEKPAADAMKAIESIPAPAATPAPAAATGPTVAPPGPTVFPPPPASDPRDVPAAKTSGPSLFRSSGPRAHST
jgi:Meckel syndrome type 1 protein